MMPPRVLASGPKPCGGNNNNNNNNNSYYGLNMVNEIGRFRRELLK